LVILIGTGTFSKSMNELRWIKSEKILAKRAFEKCYQKENETLNNQIKREDSNY
jgi:hypothetical protein